MARLAKFSCKFWVCSPFLYLKKSVLRECAGHAPGVPGNVSPYAPPPPPQFSHPNLGMTVPAHSIVHYTRSMGDLVSFVLRVPRLEEGVMFSGKALG